METHREIEELARELYFQRLAEGRELDPLKDWLEAEELVLESHRRSPSRLLPGGDLFPFAIDS